MKIVGVAAVVLLLLTIIDFSGAQVPSPRIIDVDGYPLSWLRDPQPGTPFPATDSDFTPVPLRPVSMRTMYRIPQIVGDSNRVTSSDPLLVRGSGFSALANNGVTAWVKLIEPTATSCGGAANYWYAAKTPIQMAPKNEYEMRVQLPWPPGTLETPHEFLMPWVCVCVTAQTNPTVECGDAAGKWIHTNMRYAMTTGCDGDHLTFLSNDHNNGNLDTNRLCVFRSIQSPRFEYGETSNLIPQNTNGQPTVFDLNKNNTANSRLYIERRLRTVCCGWRASSQTDPNNVGKTMMRRFGMCINPTLESCCTRTTTSLQGFHLNGTGAVGGLGKPYDKFREKCCYGGFYDSTNEATLDIPTPPQPVITSYLDDWCPCRTSQVATMCNQQQPAATSATYGCCVPSKYPEILYSSSSGPLTASTASFGTSFLNQLWGKCYDGSSLKCCDTGDLYDPGSKQCCKINGVQSINVPCPCSTDSHCGNNQTCCQDLTARMMFPTPIYEETTLCNKYVNYPNGTGLYSAQPCIGQCIDTRFQICCNGQACIDEFEVCCNSTCCNKFNQRCAIGTRAGSKGEFNNRLGFHNFYEVCTSVEGLTPFRATMVFFIPICLLAATFICLFSALNFAKRQSSLQPLSYYEWILFTTTLISVLLAWPLYFAPLYKYGIIWTWINFFVILSTLSQVRLMNIMSIVLLGVLLVYVIDPFYGNEVLTLASSRAPPPISGVFGFSGVSFTLILQAPRSSYLCTTFYDYFTRDPLVEDQLRWENPLKGTYGFCSRGFFEQFGVTTGLNIIYSFVGFHLMLMIHLRNVLFEKAQKTDDIVQQPWYS